MSRSTRPRETEAIDRIERAAKPGPSGGLVVEANDILYGGAGVLLALLAREDARATKLATAFAEGLLGRAEMSPHGTRWLMVPGDERELPNFSHGTAGVAYALARLYEVTREQRFLDAALGGAKHLLGMARTAGGVCLVPHALPDGAERYYLAYCHGPAGTARLFHQLHRVTGDATWADWFQRSVAGVLYSAIPTMRTPGFWENVGQCCGSAAIAELMLSLHRLTNDASYLDAAARSPTTSSNAPPSTPTEPSNGSTRRTATSRSGASPTPATCRALQASGACSFVSQLTIGGPRGRSAYRTIHFRWRDACAPVGTPHTTLGDDWVSGNRLGSQRAPRVTTVDRGCSWISGGDPEERVDTAKQKGMCLATRCSNVDELVAQFHKCCDETSLFVATKTMRPVGSESPFAVLLADKTPAIRGWCVVYDAWTDGKNPFGRPGLRLGIEKLTPPSREVFERMLAARAAALVESVRRPTDPPATKKKPKTVQIPLIAAPTVESPAEAKPIEPVQSISVPKAPPLSPTAFAKPPAPPPTKPSPVRVQALSLPKLPPATPTLPTTRPIPILRAESPRIETVARPPRAQSPAVIIASVPTDVAPVVSSSAAAEANWAASVAHELRTTDPLAGMLPAPDPEPEPAPRFAESSSGFARGSGSEIEAGDVELGLAGPPRPDATPVPSPPAPAAAAATPTGERAPGSNIVVPANPFTNISDDALGGFVENTLLEGAEQQPPPIPPSAAVHSDEMPVVIQAPPPPTRLAQSSQPMPLGELFDGPVPNLRPRLAIGDRQLVILMFAAGLALLLLLAVVLAI